MSTTATVISSGGFLRFGVSVATALPTLGGSGHISIGSFPTSGQQLVHSATSASAIQSFGALVGGSHLAALGVVSGKYFPTFAPMASSFYATTGSGYGANRRYT